MMKLGLLRDNLSFWRLANYGERDNYLLKRLNRSPRVASALKFEQWCLAARKLLAVLTSLLALAPVGGFATPLYSITETTGDLFVLSPDLQAILDGESQKSFPIDGADAHVLQVMLLAAYNFSVTTSLQSPEPAGETGVNYLKTGQFSQGGTPIVVVLAGITIGSDVTGGPDYASILALPQLPSSDVVANILGPAGSSDPLYFFEHSSPVPDDAVSSVWLLALALTGMFGAGRCKLVRIVRRIGVSGSDRRLGFC